MSRLIDTMIAFSIVRRLAISFESWDAFKLGIIDAEGNILIKRSKFTTSEQKEAFTKLDLLILRIKKMAGRNLLTKLASIAGAIALLREDELAEDEAGLFEQADAICAQFMLTEDEGGMSGGDASETVGSGNYSLEPHKSDKYSVTYMAKADLFAKCLQGKCKKEKFDQYISDEPELLGAVREYAQKNPSNSIILQDEHGRSIFLKYGKMGSFGFRPRG